MNEQFRALLICVDVIIVYPADTVTVGHFAPKGAIVPKRGPAGSAKNHARFWQVDTDRRTGTWPGEQNQSARTKPLARRNIALKSAPAFAGHHRLIVRREAGTPIFAL